MGDVMFILGLVLLVVGAIFDIGILFTIGIVLMVIGALLFLFGAMGRTIGPRRYYW
jgi:hypothetical protein